MASAARNPEFRRVCLLHHGASGPPTASVVGMTSQAAVPHTGLDCRWSRLRAGKVAGLCSGFAGVQSNNYWSSTTNASNTDNAWNVNLNNGNVNWNNKTNTNYVWPVRGGA